MILRILIITPLLFVPIVVYILVALTSGEGDTYARLGSTIFSLQMISGNRWTFSVGDFLLLIGLGFLFVEILKAARTKGDAIVNHSLSMILLLFCVVAFLALPGFGTSVFFLLTIMAVLDVVAGPIVSIVAARRDFGIGDQIGG